MKNIPSLSRRSFLKKSLLLAGTMAASAGLAGSYASFIEPRWVEVVRITLDFERLPASLHGKRLVQFSDIHLEHHFGLERLRAAMAVIRKENPDMVCFTGDLFDFTIADSDQTSEVLRSIEPPLGKWAVLGNHDTYSGTQETIQILTNAGYSVLINEHRQLPVPGGTIQIAGVDDLLTGSPKLEQTLQGASAEAFTILLSHSPDFADEAAQAPIDLQLSGHSHGGQVRLPFVGALITPPAGNKYVMGHYKPAGSRLQVYTNRGLGTTIHPVRFLCRPEITVITLQQAAGAAQQA